ncbi:DUF4366 domain-containing protein [Vallitalea maricola]
MKKSKIRMFAVLLMTVLCMTAFSTTAFASGGEDYTEPTPEPTETPSVPLTPEGNLTLVDDVERTDEIDKQFITAVSKNGNYFYLVIDRAGKEDNVYLLNMVDEADLLALMEDGTATPKVCSCKDKCEVGAVNGDCPVCSTDKGKCTGKAPEVTEPTDEPQPEKEKGNPMGIAALLLVFGLVGGGAFYYFKVVKNKAKPQSNPNMNEYAFSDDEDDEDEYEPAAEEQEEIPAETAEESEDDVK